jgi:hypothetical protein
VDQRVVVNKYSYHWQRSHGQLVKRWDNAPHHPEIETHPHHLHDQDEENVLPQQQPTLSELFAQLEQTV